ncbi:MAG: metallophosphoesterase, partial [Eubacteriales bacterium]|nr:metallophosphoesterase [Eubacteriales bacterium]
MKNILTVGLLSDTHLSLADCGQRNKELMSAALDGMESFSPDAVMISGDLCDWDCLSDILVTKETLDSKPWMKNTELLVTPGNHDAWCANTENYPDYAGKKVFEDYNIYEDFLSPYVYRDLSRTSPEELIKGCYHTVINGVNILCVVGYDGNHGSNAVNWLKAKLDGLRKTKNPYPVIIITHVLPTGTVFSTCSEPSRWHSGTIRRLLDGYPEALLFAGHTHVPINRSDSFWQNSFTVINNGALHVDNPAVRPGYGILEIRDDATMRYL